MTTARRALHAVRGRSTLAVMLVVSAVARDSDGQALPRLGHEAPLTWSRAIKETGDWTVSDDGALSLGKGDRKYNHALADANGSAFVRVRLSNAAEADVAVVFRARVVSSSPLRMQGYGLTLDVRAGSVGYLRWDEGGVRDPGVRAVAESLKGRTELELLVWHVGANFIGTVSDALTEEQLVSLAWSDATYATGSVGLYVNRRSGPALKAMLWVSAEPDTPAKSSTRAWLTTEWLVTLPAADLSKIPPTLKGSLKPARAQTPDEIAFITREPGIEALRRVGLAPSRAQPGVPFIYRDLQSIVRPTNGKNGKTGVKNGAPAPGLKDEETIDRELGELAQRFPEKAQLITLGTTVERRPIHGLKLADDLNDADRPAMLLFGAHHGLEVITPEIVLDAARYLLFETKDPRVAAWLKTFTIILVPVVNVDGYHSFWFLSDQVGRKNRRELPDAAAYEYGVDLERNYPFKWGSIDAQYANDVPTSFFYRGPYAGSEPESQAMMSLAAATRFIAAISYHASALKIVVPYSIDGVDNPEPSEAWAVAKGMVERLVYKFGKRRYTAIKNLYPVDGTAQDWYYNAFGTVAFILEAPASAPAKLSQLKEAVESSRPAWQYLLDRWLSGPSLSVQVKDKSTGKPLEAVVTFAELKLRAGERWTTRADTGWFHHYLPAAGTYTVRVESAGRVVEEKVEVSAGVVQVTLSL
jgi:hypothetical protein